MIRNQNRQVPEAPAMKTSTMMPMTPDNEDKNNLPFPPANDSLLGLTLSFDNDGGGPTAMAMASPAAPPLMMLPLPHENGFSPARLYQPSPSAPPLSSTTSTDTAPSIQQFLTTVDATTTTTASTRPSRLVDDARDATTTSGAASLESLTIQVLSELENNLTLDFGEDEEEKVEVVQNEGEDDTFSPNIISTTFDTTTTTTTTTTATTAGDDDRLFDTTSDEYLMMIEPTPIAPAAFLSITPVLSGTVTPPTSEPTMSSYVGNTTNDANYRRQYSTEDLNVNVSPTPLSLLPATNTKASLSSYPPHQGDAMGSSRCTVPPPNTIMFTKNLKKRPASMVHTSDATFSSNHPRHNPSNHDGIGTKSPAFVQAPSVVPLHSTFATVHRDGPTARMVPEESIRQTKRARTLPPAAATTIAPTAMEQQGRLQSSSSTAATTTASRESSMMTGGGTTRFRDYQAEQWTEKFQELCDFVKQHGHCQVPHGYPPNPSLARWTKRQRYQYKLLRKERKPSTMTEDRIDALNRVGFVWSSHGVVWEERLGELIEYRNRYGHCNVPSQYKPNQKLATWVKCQRRQFKLFAAGKNSNMTMERIRRLQILGFNWEIRYHPARKGD